MVQVEVSEGLLRGLEREIPNGDGRKIFSFKGIPYAAPPVGKLRFKAPQPPAPWEGVRDALEHGPVSPQVELATNSREPNEDESCLYLNVYTPTLDKDANLPVMFWIHGGAFKCGKGNESFFSPNTLLEKDVVLVTINYRLEAFGFLCLDIPEVPGNAGMRDQVAAMKWVQQNIINFGGDSNNVTLFGESAGSMSISLHLVSPLSRGLFHKVIMQSGVATDIVDAVESPRQLAFDLGKELGIDTEDPYELLDFLQTVDSDAFVNISEKLSDPEEKVAVPLLFVPCMEKEGLNSDAFITKHPVEYILNNEIAAVPIISGYTSLEFALVYFFMTKRFDIEGVFENTPEVLIHAKYRLENDDESCNFRNSVHKVYTALKEGIANDKGFAISSFLSDSVFVYPIVRFMKLVSEKIQPHTYMYCLSCPGKSVMHSIPEFDMTGWNVAQHTDDLGFIFHDGEADGINENVRKYFRDLWTNFAYYGNPTPDDSLNIKWTPFSRENNVTLIIDDELSLVKDFSKNQIELWEDLAQKKGLPL